MEELSQLVEQFHQQLPAEIRQYLNGRMISDQIIDQYKIGYIKNHLGFNWITIPIKDLSGNYCNLKLRREPSAEEINPTKYTHYGHGSAQLFNAEILKDESSIVICEGELDVLVLASFGIPAVSSTTGVMTFKEEWINLFADCKEVMICFDNDETGRKGTKGLADKFLQLEKPIISTINWPKKFGGKDVTDYFVQNVEKFGPDEIVASFIQLRKEVYFLGLTTAYDLMELKFDPKDKWLIERIVPKQGVIILAGHPKTFKTFLIMHFADCIANGRSVFNFYQAEKGSVLVVNEENGILLIRERLELMGINSSNIYFSNLKGVKIDQPETINKLIKVIKKLGIKLIIFDSLIRVHNRQEDSATEMKEIFSSIKPLLELTSIIFTHHHRKNRGDGVDNGQSIRGSSEIAAFTNGLFLVDRKKGSNSIVIKNPMMRDGQELEDFVVTIDLDSKPASFTLASKQESFDAKASEESKKVLEILTSSSESVTIRTIKERLPSMSESKIQKVLNDLIDSELVEKQRRAHNQYFYSLKS